MGAEGETCGQIKEREKTQTRKGQNKINQKKKRQRDICRESQAKKGNAIERNKSEGECECERKI